MSPFDDGRGRVEPVSDEVARRSDARRNRTRLLDAARAAFVERGADVPLEEVARRAGVGIGTLYRHFGDRSGLIRQVVVDHAHAVLAEARQAWVEEPTAWDALRRFVLRAGDLGDSALAPVVGGRVPRDPEVLRVVGQVSELLGRMVAGARAEGALRADVTVGDIRLLLTLLTRPLPSAPPELRRELTRRHLRLALDGMAAGDAPPLPGPALSGTQLDEYFVLEPATRSVAPPAGWDGDEGREAEPPDSCRDDTQFLPSPQ
ncbi:transcriptional regulator, TetR family [Streptoalloteichus tenebrarius]|uniref:Transcriptional regulator, TetR family n=1 Tax=Streptoalloteichus tenebrarius (strain ATCC 17920 / DSM 40477 / JCM 4838 / CBS 697.72 / NBRC 16177 / NCIMB 11028 / NRRL B-12390 / A12253. 1 / ISP 5477) TaxID=1933 RepID=A0ABT1I473_STRSD|nr:TetR/AcrR family transcriptional regulator [Streptoalloteichus tenebrarius]MCP2262589.1 transcriptional regulator, TetR family [Streptoalloteichus tenebrarius]